MPEAGGQAPVICWFRTDLRLDDNPALAAACKTGSPVIALYILDDANAGIWKKGAASKWWLHQSLAALSDKIHLTFLKGDAATELERLVEKTGAKAVFWNRRYEPWAIARDTKIKDRLKKRGIETHSFNGYMLFEPWEITGKSSGQSYKVFTPFYRACMERGDIRPPISSRPDKKKFLKSRGVSLATLGLMPSIKWYKGMEKTWRPGEDGAAKRLDAFLEDILSGYKATRDFPAEDGTSMLSPHLHFGEISPHQVWHAVSTVMARQGKNALEMHGQAYLRQLIWREFSWHLLYHAPDFPEKPWNAQFARFPWRRDKEALLLWQEGKTGYPIVDAGMRQLWQTGWMHNRVRMIVGSFLVKNLLLHWREGEDWFWDTLVDADLANNASGWQWIAGCGADAAPYFRIFNPILQSRKFDQGGAYIRQYVPELEKLSDKSIHAPWEATADELRKAGVTLGKTYPHPIIDHSKARERALRAYEESRSAA